MNIVNVVLDADTVTHNLAARLSTCLLGHVLFLKNQVPLSDFHLSARCVVFDLLTHSVPSCSSRVCQQMMHAALSSFMYLLVDRVSRQTSSRAAKMKQELITSFDTLASHLYTTFIALSTSLALRGITETNNTVSMPPVNTSRIGRVFMAILLGPTVGTAKARVILGIDGFEVKRWGFREDEFGRTTECDAEDNEAENEDDQIGTDEDDSGHAPSSESDSEDTESSSPPSRSSSPSLSESSSISSSDIPDPHQDTARTSPDPLRTAERHLSRILANACAEDTNGEGLASEMGSFPANFMHLFRR